MLSHSLVVTPVRTALGWRIPSQSFRNSSYRNKSSAKLEGSPAKD